MIKMRAVPTCRMSALNLLLPHGQENRVDFSRRHRRPTDPIGWRCVRRELVTHWVLPCPPKRDSSRL
jgi:hypothetical protein